MNNSAKILMLGLLLVPFAAMNFDNAHAATFNVNIAAGSGVPGCEVENNCFDPFEITVPVGATVVWKNGDSQGHTVTSGNPTDEVFGQEFDSSFPLLPAEKTFEHTFDTAGTFPYFCQVHPYMLGKVIVGGAEESMEEEMEEEMPEEDELTLRLPTDNGSTTVVVSIDKGMLHGSEFMIDPPSAVTFSLTFVDSSTGRPLEHVNYQFHVADQSGAMVAHEMAKHSMGGTETKSVTFSDTGSYTITVVVEGTGASKPYDTSHSGTATSGVTVTPEFPLAVMAIMAATAGIGVAATRFKNPLKL